jgi:DNA recombination protein RmuC
MDGMVVFAVIVVGLVLAGLVALAGVVLAEERRRAGALQGAVTEAVTELQLHAAAERDAAVTAALQQAAVLNREALGAQAAAGQQDLAAKRDSIAVGLGEVRQELARVTELVGRLGEKHASVETQLRAHAELTQHLAATTQGLREALANPKARGQWGERMADDILRHAGFVEHVNYEKQTAVEGGRAIPDFTFFLPKGQVLYMDVKFPLAAYVRHLEADTEAEREAHRVAFLRDVRLRVKELAERRYPTASAAVAVDHVLLFLPNESVSGFVHEHDPTLLDDALRQNVVLCSPLNLFVLLGVIRQAHENFAVERTADDMLATLGAFQAQWARFTEAMDVVDKRLDTARRGFDELIGPRRRQLEKPLARLEELRLERGLPADASLLPGGEVVALRDPA